MPVIEVNKRWVHVQELNKDGAETVVLLHGMFSNLSVYYFQIAPLLARHFHVLMYDLRSHGLSERVATGYGLEQMGVDFRDLLDRLELGRVHVAGYSFGGLIGLKAAVSYPGRIAGLALIDVPDPADQKARDIIDIYSREFLEHYIENFADTTRIRIGKRQFEKNHRMYEYLFHATTIREDMLGDANFLQEGGLEQLKNVLLIYGKQSNCLQTGRDLKARLQDGTRLMMIDGDHNVPVQQPLAVGRALDQFFNKMNYIEESYG